jgi:hypothetical protein
MVLAFCMGQDIQAVLDDPIGQPMATVCQRPAKQADTIADAVQIFNNAFGQKGTLALWAIVVAVQ